MVKPRKTGTKASHYTTLVLPPCKICSGEATGYHFGLMSCEACKAFFRRSLVQKKSPKCKKRGKCTISSETTTNCGACRLKLCQEYGMSKEGVRRGRFSLQLRTKAIVEANALEGKSSSSTENETPRDDVRTSTDDVKPFENDVNGLMLAQINTSDVRLLRAPQRRISDDGSSDSGLYSLDELSPINDSSFSGGSTGSPSDGHSSSTSFDSSLALAILSPTSPPPSTTTSASPWQQDSMSAALMDTGLGLVQTSEFEYLIDSLVNTQEFVYPTLKKYFDKPLDQLHRDIFLQFNKKQEIFEDMFGPSQPVSTKEYQMVFAETGLDVDERLAQFNMYGRAMEESITQYQRFSQLIPGFYKLADDDVTRLRKAGHLEFWMFGSHMLFNKEFSVAMCWDGSQNGTREHMTKFFDADWIDKNFEFADSLNKLKLTFEEIVLIRAIILTSADRGRLAQRGEIHSLQERYFECLRYHLTKTTSHPTQRLYKLFDRLLAIRNVTHLNIRVNLKFLNDWGFVMQDYPLWREMLSFDDL